MLVVPRKEFKRRAVLSRSFVQASSRRLSIASGLPVIPLPITIGVWAFLTDNSVVSSLVYFNNTSDTTSQIGMDIAGTVANDPFRVWGGNSASSINNPPFNQWAHFAGVFTSTTSRTAYINGVAGTTDTGSGSTNALNTRLDVGALFRSDFGSGVNFMSGRIAVVAIWAAELTATELRLLAAGADARRIRPDTLRWLWELEGTGNEFNKAAFYQPNDGILVPANAPLPAAGPVLERLAPRRLGIFPASAGGGSLSASIDEALASADTVSAILSTSASVTESASLTDTVSTTLAALADLTETISLTDAESSAIVLPVDLTETATLSDASSTTLLLAAVLTETASLTDAQTALAALAAVVQETLTLADVASCVTTALASLTETVSLTDLVSTGPVVTADLTEALSPTDTVTALSTRVAAVSEALTLLDSIVGTSVRTASLAETLSLIDQVVASLGGVTSPLERVLLRSRITQAILERSRVSFELKLRSKLRH